MTNDAVMLFCALCGLAGFIVSLICVAMIAGFVRSTHTVQYVPAEPMDIPDPLKFMEEETKEEEQLFDNLGRKKKKPKDPISELIEDEMEDVTKTDALY